MFPELHRVSKRRAVQEHRFGSVNEPSAEGTNSGRFSPSTAVQKFGRRTGPEERGRGAALKRGDHRPPGTGF